MIIRRIDAQRLGWRLKRPTGKRPGTGRYANRKAQWQGHTQSGSVEQLLRRQLLSAAERCSRCPQTQCSAHRDITYAMESEMLVGGPGVANRSTSLAGTDLVRESRSPTTRRLGSGSHGRLLVRLGWLPTRDRDLWAATPVSSPPPSSLDGSERVLGDEDKETAQAGKRVEHLEDTFWRRRKPASEKHAGVQTLRNWAALGREEALGVVPWGRSPRHSSRLPARGARCCASPLLLVGSILQRASTPRTRASESERKGVSGSKVHLGERVGGEEEERGAKVEEYAIRWQLRVSRAGGRVERRRTS
eukprot:3333463-Rhodomonas_salina.3